MDAMMQELSTVIKALVNGEREDKKKYAMDILKIMEELPYDFRNPDIFNTMFMFPLEEVLNAIAQGLQEGEMGKVVDTYRPQFAFVHYQFLEANIIALIKKRTGDACSSDKTRHILSMYLKYSLTGNIPETDYEEHYWLPKFGENKEWIDFCNGLYHLYFGNPDKYFTSYKALLEAGIRKYPHILYTLYASLKDGREVKLYSRYDNEDFFMEKQDGYYNLPKNAFKDKEKWEDAKTQDPFFNKMHYQVPEEDVLAFRTDSQRKMV